MSEYRVVGFFFLNQQSKTHTLLVYCHIRERKKILTDHKTDCVDRIINQLTQSAKSLL